MIQKLSENHLNTIHRLTQQDCCTISASAHGKKALVANWLRISEWNSHVQSMSVQYVWTCFPLKTHTRESPLGQPELPTVLFLLSKDQIKETFVYKSTNRFGPFFFCFFFFYWLVELVFQMWSSGTYLLCLWITGDIGSGVGDVEAWLCCVREVGGFICCLNCNAEKAPCTFFTTFTPKGIIVE